MPPAQRSVYIGLAVPDQHQQAVLLAQRIASRQQSRGAPPADSQVLGGTKAQYRQYVLRKLEQQCGGGDRAKILVQQFVNLASAFEDSKAIGFEGVPGAKVLVAAHTQALSQTDQESVLFAHQHAHHLHDSETDQGPLHPLLVLLLAYRMGGPINAANTASAHVWKRPENPVGGLTDMQIFHVEGDTGDIMEDHRITFVWEMKNGVTHRPSGGHSIFVTGGVTPKDLSFIKCGDKDAEMPVAVVYDAKKVAYYYYPHGHEHPESIRNSITLDFQVNTVDEEVLARLGVPPAPDELERMTLSKLLLSFRIPDYAGHFHRLLFSETSIAAIASKLESPGFSLTLPPTSTSSSTVVAESSRHQSYHEWHTDNVAHAPKSVRNSAKVQLSGIHSSHRAFLQPLRELAIQDLHSSIGIALFPQSPADGHREWARKSFRDLTDTAILDTLGPYMVSMLGGQAFTTSDLITTHQLHLLADCIHNRALDLVSRGYADTEEQLYSVACFSRAIGTAFNGPKEAQVSPQRRIDEHDLQVFRTRCLYLFLCADWLAGFLKRPNNKGSNMVAEIPPMEMEVIMQDVEWWCGTLLRNWVAWELFVEGLPARPFKIQHPVS